MAADRYEAASGMDVTVGDFGGRRSLARHQACSAGITLLAYKSTLDGSYAASMKDPITYVMP